MSKNKPKVGDRLFSENCGNACGRGRPKKLTEVEVVKVGRKYFQTCQIDRLEYYPESTYTVMRYHISDWKEVGNYTPISRLHESQGAFHDQQERRKLLDEVKSFIGGWGDIPLNLDQVRRISAIIKEENQ